MALLKQLHDKTNILMKIFHTLKEFLIDTIKIGNSNHLTPFSWNLKILDSKMFFLNLFFKTLLGIYYYLMCSIFV